jgi:hypothetical protein
MEIFLSMVFIEDRDGVFNASIDKVWKLVQAHVADGAKIHPRFKNITTDIENENTFTCTWEENINGQTRKMMEKGTIFYPLGVAYEFIEGPFLGSKYFVYYIPQEDNKTRVIMAGDFKLAPADLSIDNEKDQRSIVLSAFEKVFNEDCIYLKSME